MDNYQTAIAQVLSTTDAYSPRNWTGQRQKLPGGVPIQGMSQTVYGPQAATVSVKIRDEDLPKLLAQATASRLSYVAKSPAYVYHSGGVVKVEFTLPGNRWRIVPLAGLPQHRDSLAVGQQATGAVARMTWTEPHKAIFGSTQNGKSTFMVDYLIALVKTYEPDECKLFLANPKNDDKFLPVSRVPHLGHPAVSDYAECERMLRLVHAEALTRRDDPQRRQRWVVFIDEVAELIDNRPAVADIVKSLSQIGGGLNINLVVASQSANPSVFGRGGSKSKTNFGTRVIFSLPSSQSYLATDISGRQYPIENLGRGGKGDCIIVKSGQITRCRAALPSPADYDSLPRIEAVTPMPGEPVGDRGLVNDRVELDYADKVQRWTVEDLGRAIEYALFVSVNTEKIRLESGVSLGTQKAMAVRDLAVAIKKFNKERKNV